MLIFLSIAAMAGPLERTESWAGLPSLTPRSSTLDGEFTSFPAPQWSVRLPGPPLNSAAHTERSQPAVWRDEILIGSAAGKALYRMSREDGAVLGSYAASASVESTATIVMDRVYFSDTSGTTWCYTLNGEKIWSHQSNAPILTQPTVSGGFVYIVNVDDIVVAINAEDGTQRWRYQPKKDITRKADLQLYAAPSVVIDEGVALTGFSSGELVALDADGGEVLWSVAVGEGRYPDLVATPKIVGADILVSGYYQPLLAIDKITHSVRWRAEYGAAFPVSTQGSLIFHPGADGVLRAFNKLTGAEKWSWDSGLGAALTEPKITKAGIVVGGVSGGLFVVDPKTGTGLWEWHEPILLEGTTASPVIAGRQLLFVSNSGDLYSMVSPIEREADRPSHRRIFRGRR